MRAALRELLTGLIDYAGLFPPASLPLGEAVRNYLEYRAGPDAWMLGRFVLQASRLHELADIGAGMPIAALGRGGADEASFVQGLKDDLADIERCRARLGDKAAIDTLETKPPPGLVPDLSACRAARLRVFLEHPAGIEPALPRGAGLKVRTGGLEASAFPSSEALVKSATWAAWHGVPFKATAGLHHPLPRQDAASGGRMHGFVNLFLASAMLDSFLIGPDEARALLECDDPARLAIDGDAIRWSGFRIGANDLRASRRRAMSFGSCSFDEPRDDLKELGWMGAAR